MADGACPAKYNSADSEQDNFAGYAGVTLKELGIKVADEVDAPDGLRTAATCNANFGTKWSTPAQTCPETAPLCNCFAGGGGACGGRGGVCGIFAPATYSAVDPDGVRCQELIVPGSIAGFTFWSAQGYKVRYGEKKRGEEMQEKRCRRRDAVGRTHYRHPSLLCLFTLFKQMKSSR